MLLNYKEQGLQSDPAVFFLHGLLGNAGNWGSTSAELAESGLRCIAVDQRNHGSSPHSGSMSYPLMAGDLIELADSLDLENFSLVGHSMGGKTAMETALRFPERVRALVVADMAPIEYEPSYSNYLNSLREADLSGVKSRSEAAAELEKYIDNREILMFFLTNLKRKSSGGYKWRINVEGLAENYHNIWRALEGGRSYGGPALFIRGENSKFIQDKNLDIIKEFFPDYSLETLAGAGHWIHTEKPAEFRAAVRQFLANTP